MRGGVREIAKGDGSRVFSRVPADGTGGVLFRDVTITTAQMLALNATPIEVIPAPGAGYALVLDSVLAYKPAGTAYAAIHTDDDIAFKYTDANGAAVAEIEATGFLDQATAQTRFAQSYRAASAESSMTPSNTPIVAHMLNGEVTTGTSDLKLRLFYRIIPLVLA